MFRGLACPIERRARATEFALTLGPLDLHRLVGAVAKVRAEKVLKPWQEDLLFTLSTTSGVPLSGVEEYLDVFDQEVLRAKCWQRSDAIVEACELLPPDRLDQDAQEVILHCIYQRSGWFGPDDILYWLCAANRKADPRSPGLMLAGRYREKLNALALKRCYEQRNFRSQTAIAVFTAARRTAGEFTGRQSLTALDLLAALRHLGFPPCKEPYTHPFAQLAPEIDELLGALRFVRTELLDASKKGVSLFAALIDLSAAANGPTLRQGEAAARSLSILGQRPPGWRSRVLLGLARNDFNGVRAEGRRVVLFLSSLMNEVEFPIRALRGLVGLRTKEAFDVLLDRQHFPEIAEMLDGHRDDRKDSCRFLRMKLPDELAAVHTNPASYSAIELTTIAALEDGKRSVSSFEGEGVPGEGRVVECRIDCQFDRERAAAKTELRLRGSRLPSSSNSDEKMDVVCPICRTVYQVPTSKANKKARCAPCDHRFVVPPDE